MTQRNSLRPILPPGVSHVTSTVVSVGLLTATPVTVGTVYIVVDPVVEICCSPRAFTDDKLNWYEQFVCKPVNV